MADFLNLIFGTADMAVFRFFGNLQCPFLTAFFRMVTLFGDGRTVTCIFILGCALLLSKKTRTVGTCILFSMILSIFLTNVLLKPLVNRPRPYVLYENNAQFMKWFMNAGSLKEKDYSFPSGHTTAAFSYCTVLFLIFRKKYRFSWILQVIAVFVMISRVYLMVHFASDVIAGMIIGIACACIAYDVCTPSHLS